MCYICLSYDAETLDHFTLQAYLRPYVLKDSLRDARIATAPQPTIMSPRSPLLLLLVLLFVRGFSCAIYAPVEIYAQELDEQPNGLFYYPSYGDYSTLTGPYLMALIPYSQNWNVRLFSKNICVTLCFMTVPAGSISNIINVFI